MNATHARSDGKVRRQASIVWELRVGPLQLRCLVAAPGFKRYRVEAKEDGAWRRFADSDDAWSVLRLVTAAEATGRAVTASALRATMTAPEKK
jgi:hypothetical protein